MEIDLLYFAGCPSWQIAKENLNKAMQADGVVVPVHLVEVKSDQQAEELHFLGSPSFRLNGIEFWPEERENYSMSCRVYRTPEGMKGWPTVEMFRLRLISLLGKEDRSK